MSENYFENIYIIFIIIHYYKKTVINLFRSYNVVFLLKVDCYYSTDLQSFLTTIKNKIKCSLL